MLYLSFVLAFCSFVVCLYTYTRVARVYKSLKNLDWQSLGTLTGDVGALKVAYQRLNNRIGGMTSTREKMDINDIAIQAIQNGQAVQQQKKTNGIGG